MIQMRWIFLFFLLLTLQQSSSTSTTDLAVVMFEAEDAALYRCDRVTNHAGYSGAGYVDFQRRGSFMEWQTPIEIRSEDGGDYEIAIRYSSITTRPLHLLLNLNPLLRFDMISTPDWDTWATERHVVSLPKGTHKFRLIARESHGPNVDRMSVTPMKALDEELQDILDFLENKPTGTPTQTPTTAAPTKILTVSPTKAPSKAPTRAPTTSVPTKAPSQSPTPPPTYPLPPRTIYPSKVVLKPDRGMKEGDIVYSPSRQYRVLLDDFGDFVVQDSSTSSTIWSAGILWGSEVYLQGDGNLIVRNVNSTLVWASNTNRNPGAQLVLDDGGQLAVVKARRTGSTTDTKLWIAGRPRGTYTGPSSPDLEFPVRGSFYYAWYPETWTVNGALALFEPSLGYYNSADPYVVASHIDQLEYSHTDVGIISWWGPDQTNDRARISLLLDTTLAMDSNLKWTVYYESEMDSDYSVSKLVSDLEYLKKWFAWHPSFAHKDGKPVIFVYNNDGCEEANRWHQANLNNEWYVVLKVFKDYQKCQDQPER